MHKKLLKFLSSFLLVLVCCSIFASATYTRESPRIATATVSLSKDRYGDLGIDCFIRANGVMNTIGVSSIKIERYNGSKWVEEDTLTEDDLSGLMANNVMTHSVEVTYPPLYPSNSYRAVVSFLAKNSEGSSTKSITSNSV